MYKASKGIALKIQTNVFSCNYQVNYDLRYQFEFSRPLAKSVFNGTEAVSYLGQRICDIVPLGIKQKESLTAFQKSIKTWNPHHCPWRLRKIYVPGSDLLIYAFLGLFMSFWSHLTLRAHMETFNWLVRQVDC